MKNGIAVLEEFLQEKYVELYDDIKDDDNKVLALINNSSTSKYFYKPDVGALQYIVDTEGHALYLINKDGLPKEIKQSLVGGEAGNKKYSDYASLIDVYGVTTDLKVYYCSNGVDSLYGLSKENLDNDNPLREVFSNSDTSTSLEMYNLVTSYDKDGDGTITAEEVKSVNKLTIDSSSSISNLKDLYNFVSLQELTIDSKDFDNLDGIQNCMQLNYVYFKTSTIGDYSALKGLSNNLKYLYFYKINDSEMSKICDKSKGIGGQDFNNLQYLAFSGTQERVCAIAISGGEVTGDNYDKTSKNENLTTIKPLENLTDNTCLAVKYLSLQNNSISSLSPLTRFKQVILLRAEKNNIVSLNGLENMELLNYLFLQENRLGENEEILQDNDDDKIDDGVNNTNSLKALEKLDKLVVLGLSENTSLKFIHYISNSNSITTLTLNNVLDLEFNSLCSIKKIINDCNYRIIPSKYSLLLLDESTTVLDLSNQTLELNQFGLLKDNKNILDLNLMNLVINDRNGIALTGANLDETINSILETMTSIQNLSLKNVQISDMSFVKNLNNLTRVDLVGTNLSTGLKNSENENIGLELLNNSQNLIRLMFDGVADLSLLQDTVNRCSDCEDYYSVFNWTYEHSGLYVSNETTIKSLEKCYNISKLCMGLKDVINSSELDLSDLRELVSVRFRCLGESFESVKLPYSVKTLSVSNGCIPDLRDCKDLAFLGLYASRSSGMWAETHFCSKRTDIEVVLTWCGLVEHSLDFLNGLGVKTLNLRNFSVYSGDFDCFNINLPNLRNLYIKNIISVNEDIGGIRDFTTLTDLQIAGCNISDISGLENLTSLTSLDLSTNSISNLNSLKNLKSLTTLNLANNLIYNTSSFKGEDGCVITVKNLEILGDLNPLAGKEGHLTSLYLEGNNAITNFDPVKGYTNWLDKSGF